MGCVDVFTCEENGMTIVGDRGRGGGGGIAALLAAAATAAALPAACTANRAQKVASTHSVLESSMKILLTADWASYPT